MMMLNAMRRSKIGWCVVFSGTMLVWAVPRAEQRFVTATRIWISGAWLSGCVAAMLSPKAFKHRIFAWKRFLAPTFPIFAGPEMPRLMEIGCACRSNLLGGQARHSFVGSVCGWN